MEHYTVTNIRITREELKKLKQAALERDESVSALLRTLIREVVGVQRKEKGNHKEDMLWRLPKYAIKTNNKKLSASIDSIVYGA